MHVELVAYVAHLRRLVSSFKLLYLTSCMVFIEMPRAGFNNNRLTREVVVELAVFLSTARALKIVKK